MDLSIQGINDWGPLVLCIIGVLGWLWGKIREKRNQSAPASPTMIPNYAQPNLKPPPRSADSPPKQPWKIPGARTGRFELYRAACLIVGEEPVWPLQTQRSRDEYAALCEDLRTEQLDDPESDKDETLSYEFGYRSGDEEDGTPSTVHEMELDRRNLRRYLYRHSRAIPEFLEERFDHQLGEQPTP